MVDTREIGYVVDSSTVMWSSLAAGVDEANPDLRWPQCIPIYDRMRREESQVKSVLKAVTLPIRSTHWALDPTGVREEVLQVCADDLGLPIKGRTAMPRKRGRNRFSWSDHLRLALLELPHGHAVFEQAYRIDSAHLARLHKLAWRPPKTIEKFDVARDGGLEAVWQKGAKKPMGVERLVVYVNEREGGNWAGESLLRSAYKNWLLKDKILRSQALTIDRNGLGVPIHEAAPVPEGASAEQRDAWIKAERDNGLALAKAFRAGETAGASLNHGAKLTLKGVEGDLPDTDKPIRYHDEQIARAVLAHFLNLGTETGSWALGSTFADFFVASLQATATHIADVTQQHVIDDLVDLNWGEDEPAPQLVFEEIGSKSPATAEAIKQLLDCKAITPDETLEADMRQKYGLPVRDRSTARPEEGAA